MLTRSCILVCMLMTLAIAQLRLSSIRIRASVALCMDREVLICELALYDNASLSYYSLTQDRHNVLIECPHIPEDDSIIGVVFSETNIRSIVAIHSVTFSVSSND